ncbi:MAG: cupin-like domain-containing protein [Candidatus Acidiferrales bacterium]
MVANKMRGAHELSRAHSQREGYVRSLLEALGAQYKQSLSVEAFCKVDRLTPAEFYRHYYFANRPVVIRGLMRGWKALRLWTPDYFARKFGQCTLQINRGRNDDLHYARNFADHNAKILMKDYVAMIQSGGETNDYYIEGRNSLLSRRPFRVLFSHFTCPKGFLDPHRVKRKAKLWFGPKGTVSPLHHDQGNGMLGQIHGRKRIKLIPPFETQNLRNDECFSDVNLEKINYKKFPSMKGVTILDTVLEPGEFIFIPIGWWHWVKSLDVSVSLTFTNFLVPGKPVAWQWRYGT